MSATFTMNHLSFHRKMLLAALLISVAILAVRVLTLDNPDVVMDDAYISFRYAVNLAEGRGLVFNPGEYVEGYTNFLWTLVLAGCAYLGLDIVLAAKVLAMGAAVGTLLVLYRFSLRLFVEQGRHWLIAALPLILFAVMPSQARYVVSGMETLLFVFLVAWAVYLFYRRRWLAAGLVFSLAAMTRPEGVIYFALTCGFALVFLGRELLKQQALRTFALRFVGGFVAIYGLYFLWRYSYYGFPLPNTFYAKASGFSVARLERGWRYLDEIVRSWSVLPLFVLGAFALPSVRRERAWLLFIALPLITVLYFIYVGGDFLVWFGPRFLMPILPFLLLAVAEGLFRIAAFMQRRALTLGFASAGALILIVNGLYFSWPARFDPLIVFSAQMRSWKELGIWMQANLPADTTIATDAAGLIPFYSQLYAIDMYGLTDAYIAHLELPNPGAGVVAHEKFDPFYIMRRQPDCIVSTWVSDSGQAFSAGLDAVGAEVVDRYRLVAVAKVRYGAPIDQRWVITTAGYTPELYAAGYQTGLFCLKTYQLNPPTQGLQSP